LLGVNVPEAKGKRRREEGQTNDTIFDLVRVNMEEERKGRGERVPATYLRECHGEWGFKA